MVVCTRFTSCSISIHAPLTGSDQFNSHRESLLSDFNPRSPYGERPCSFRGNQFSGVFQSTLPLRGATSIRLKFVYKYQFQSTLPLRGATTGSASTEQASTISIHAPLTGSDRWVSSSWAAVSISIHAPLTGSDGGSYRLRRRQEKFQSTLPLRGATPLHTAVDQHRRFQSTLPLRGATVPS